MKINDIVDNRITSASALDRTIEHRVQEQYPSLTTELQEMHLATCEIGNLSVSQPAFEDPSVVEQVVESDADNARLAAPSWHSNRMCG